MKPNIIFIMTDQHNAKLMRHKNHVSAKTTNFDRMVSEGVRFENAITQNPIYTPSKVSFLSGQYTYKHGYQSFKGPNQGGLPNILSHCKKAEYTSGAVGKIQCPEYWIANSTDYFRAVFKYI